VRSRKTAFLMVPIIGSDGATNTAPSCARSEHWRIIRNGFHRHPIERNTQAKLAPFWLGPAVQVVRGRHTSEGRLTLRPTKVVALLSTKASAGEAGCPQRKKDSTTKGFRETFSVVGQSCR